MTRKDPSIGPQDDAETVLHKLETGLLEHVARRIRYLELEIDEEEGEEPIDLKSLHRFAQFMLENRAIGSPSTWIDHLGFLGLEWRIPYLESVGEPADVGTEHWGRGDGILAMVFLPSGLVRFSGTSGPVWSGYRTSECQWNVYTIRHTGSSPTFPVEAGNLMIGGIIPDDHHIARYCRPKQTEQGFPSVRAFHLRPADKDALSVNWLEHYTRNHKVVSADERELVIAQIRDHIQMDPSSNGRFAVLNVGQVKVAHT